MRLALLVLSISTAATFVVLFSGSILAQNDYLLEQEILPIDCTKTSTDNGSSTSITTACDDAIAPTVDPLSTTDTSPVITGTFEASIARELWVIVNGVTYVLGEDSALRTSGNIWILDLGQAGQTLSTGVYTVQVFVETIDNLLLGNTGVNQLVIESTVVSGQSESRQTGNLVDTGNAYWAFPIISLVSLLFGLLLLRRYLQT